MDLKEEVLLQVNSVLNSNKDNGPLLFILTLENGVASHCFLNDNTEFLPKRLQLFNWKESDPIGVLLVDPEIYDYEDAVQLLESTNYNILSVFEYFPESCRLNQVHQGVRYPYKIIECGVEIQSYEPDLGLLKRDLKDRLDRMIQYLEKSDKPSDEVLREMWLLTLKYKNTIATDLEDEISRLEYEITVMQTMFNQLETSIALS